MSDPTTLTVACLINIIGEEKLYSHLEGKLYQYVTPHIKSNMPTIFTFRTNHNPVEWLIFNNKTFIKNLTQTATGRENTRQFIETCLEYLLSSKHGEEWRQYVEYRDFDILRTTDFVYSVGRLITESDNIPNNISEAAWKDIKELTCGELNDIMDICYYNGYIVQIKEGIQENFLTLNSDILVKELGEQK